MVLNGRLAGWCQQHGLRAEGQDGFRRGLRTTNQLLVLCAACCWRKDSKLAAKLKCKLCKCYVDTSQGP
jgi:hypothetical protein